MDKRLMAICFAVFFISACVGNKKTESQFSQATPFKVLTEEINGEILTGIGTSEKKSNFSLMREAAITSAQADLARKIQSKVEAVWKRTMSDWSEYKKEGFSETMSVDQMKTFQKSIVDIELRGPWQTQELRDNQSGRYWVRILYSSSVVEKWVKNRMSEYVLKEFFVKSKIQTIRESFKKNLEDLRNHEKMENSKIAEIVK